MSDKLDVRFNDDVINNCIGDMIEIEKSGWLNKHISAARRLCNDEKIPVCDCNKIWNTLKDNDVDINNIFSNRINHPTEKPHWMFAYELVRTVFTD